MYLKYWGLTQMPFENTPDPRFLYQSAQHEEALVRMLYVIENRKGAGMLTGVFGCGKTLIGEAVANELAKEKYKVAFITNPRLDDVNLLRMIAYFLGGVEPLQEKSDVLISLNKILQDNMRDGRDTIVIIDEAHCVEDNNIFEELRLLLNFQLPDRFLLTLLFFGQPELAQKVELNRQLNQRIAIKCHLDHLDAKETRHYIGHRLQVAGSGKRQIFEQEALDAAYHYSGGIPRKINQICDLALFTGCGLKKKTVDTGVIKEVTQSLAG